MGKRRFTPDDISEIKTARLGIDELLVVDNGSTETHIEAIHRRYFKKELIQCPSCGSDSRTRVSKITTRGLKDIIWDDEIDDYRVIDLIFYQRYYRCGVCKSCVFPEPVMFCTKGARYTKRLEDAIAKLYIRCEDIEQFTSLLNTPITRSNVNAVRHRVNERK